MSAVDATAAATTAERSRELAPWVRHHYGEDFEPARLTTLDGHSGLTYGFDVVDTTGRVADALVLRLPPAGGRSRNADVLRQIPVLEAMSTAGVPVADVVSPGADETWFGSPYLMTRRAPGQTVSIDVPDRPVTAEHVEQAVYALAQVHSVDWTLLAAADWDSPADYRSELRLWDRAREKMPSPELKEAAERLALELEARLPGDARTAVVHGDFQFSNLLFDHDHLTAVLDWEVASIGPRLLDLAWFAEINNPHSWAHDVYTAEIPSAERMRTWYENAAGVTVEEGEFAFARALACYRFAVIAGLNLHLHRTGRRTDPHWEIIAPSIPVLLGQGLTYVRAG